MRRVQSLYDLCMVDGLAVELFTLIILSHNITFVPARIICAGLEESSGTLLIKLCVESSEDLGHPTNTTIKCILVMHS